MPCVAPDPVPAVDFWATVNPVDSMLAVAWRLLRIDLNIPPAQIAVLREASTAFGAASQSKPSAGAAPGAALEPGAKATPTPGCAPATGRPRVGAAEWLEVPVPMNVSRLRGDLLRTLAATPALPGTPAAGRAPLDLQDPATARENLPVLSRLSAPAAERTLEDIAQTLLAHRVRAVVIVATDVRDRIFLANEVRTRLRDVKVVVIGSHSLYLRPEVNQALRGTLVVSSYPLFLESQFWDAGHGPGRQRFAFTSDMAEGTFNATLLQLGEAHRVVDYTYPLAALGLRPRAAVPLAARAPPVWTTVVGRAAMLPVRADSLGWTAVGGSTAHWYVYARPAAAVRADADSATALSVLPPSEAALSGSSLDDWVIAGVLGMAALFAFGGFRVADGGGLLGSRASAAPQAVGWWAGAFRWHKLGAARTARTARYCSNPWCAQSLELELHAVAWTLLRHAALLGTLAPVVLALSRGRIHGVAAAVDALTPPGLALVVAWFAVGLSAEEMVRLWPLFRTYGWRAVLVALRPAVIAGIAAMYAGLTVWLCAGAVRGAAAEPDVVRRAASTVFNARALQLGSGVSPLVPLVVGGLVVLASAAWHLRRVEQLREVTTFEAACTAGEVAAPGRAGPRPARASLGDQFRWLVDARRRRPAPALGSARAFAAAVRSLRAHLVTLAPSAAAGVLVALLWVLVLWIAAHIERTPETLALGPVGTTGWAPLAGTPLPSTFDLLFRFLLAAALTLAAWTLFRFVGTWGALRRCLQELSATRLVPAFGRLPKLLPELSRLTPFSMPEKRVADAAFDAIARDRWAALARAHPDADAAIRAGMRAAAERHLGRGERLDEPGQLPLPLGGDDPTRVPALAAAYGVLYSTDAADADAPAPHAESARAVVQEIAALYVVDYVEWVVRHLRRLAFAVLVTLVLATVLLSSYPFEPQSLVKATLFVLMATSVVALLAALVQMNRDPVLSAITHTHPGEVTWDARFVVNLVLVGAVPALTLLGTQFPEVRDFLFSWVTPILRTVGRN